MNIVTETAKVVGLSAGFGMVSVLTLPSARSVLPQAIVDLSAKYLAEPLRALRTRIVQVLPPITTAFGYGKKITTNWTMLAVAATLEELLFRYMIQSVVLREAPKRVLKMVAPSYEHIVDHKIANVARVVLTSTLFTLAHVMRMGHFPGMLVAQLVFGLYFSYKRECGAGIAELSAVHFSFNVVGALIAGGVNEATITLE